MWRKPFCAFLNPKYGDILPYLRDHYELKNFLAECARNPFVARAVMPCYAMSRRVVETAENRPRNRSMLPKPSLFGAVRRRTLICWRSAKFSATRATLNRKSPMNAHQINLQRSHIGRQHRPCCLHLLAR